MKSQQIQTLGILIILFFMTLLNDLMAQSMHYVDDDNTTGTENGTKQYPYRNIQEAINSVTGLGEKVKIAAGTYVENIRIEDKTVALFGGYTGGTSTNYANGDGGNFDDRDPAANTSHIQGDRTDAVVKLIFADTSRLDGFRITGGTRSTYDEYYDKGGGVYCYGGSPTISNNIIEDNDSRPPTPSGNEAEGGGLYGEDSNLTIRSNIIRNNISGRGAGIGIFGGTVVISDNIVRNNVGVSDHGGGMYIASPSAEITDNLIFENEIGREAGYGWGGGIIVYGEGTYTTLFNNEITRNSAPTSGSGVFIDDGAEAVLDHELIHNNVGTEIGGVGVYVDGAGEGVPGDVGSKATLLHCTIANNNSYPNPVDGNGVFIERNSQVTIKNSIFWNNGGNDFAVDGTSTLQVIYTVSEESMAGEGNITEDPLFADPDNGDYHLRSTAGRWDPSANNGSGGWVVDTIDSPCIDAGDTLSDYSNEPDYNGDRVNMGVYGNTDQASLSRGKSAINGSSKTPKKFALYQNYPNPFNPSTIIKFELPKTEGIKIEIFNALGQKVATLLDKQMKIGFHEVKFNAQTLPSGLYIYRLVAGNFIAKNKCLFLK